MSMDMDETGLARINALLEEVGPRPASVEDAPAEAVESAAAEAVTQLAETGPVLRYDPALGMVPADLNENEAEEFVARQAEQDEPTVADRQAAQQDMADELLEVAMSSYEGREGIANWQREMERRRREQAVKEHAREMFGKIQEILGHVKFPAEMEATYRGTLALYAIHTWVHRYQDSTPYILITSPAAESGKSTALEVLASLVSAPVMENSLTASNLISYANDGCTIMIDEADELGKDKQFKAAINSGYKQSGFVTRKVGKEQKRFSTYSPKVIAGIAREKMPVEGATLTRCINIRLQRALPGEVRKFRPRHPETREVIREIRDWVRDWAETNSARLSDAYPEVPASVGNRAAELWEPLLAVAEALGDEIAAQAREWVGKIQGQAEKAVDPNVSFLADIRAVLDDWKPTRTGTRIRVADLHQAWLSMPERSFAEGLDLNRFSRRLASFGLTSTPDKGSRWYRVVDAQGEYVPAWDDTFRRYSPSAE